MPRTSDARERAIATAERLFRSQGYAATGLTQIIEESGSPKGSFYFHFPGGKRQLAIEMLALYRSRTLAGFRLLAERADGDPKAFVCSLIDAAAAEMKKSDWSSGCAAQVLAQELAPHDDEIADAVAALFEDWTNVIAAAIAKPGQGKAAREQALALVASLEGARTLARAQRGAAAFAAVKARFTA